MIHKLKTDSSLRAIFLLILAAVFWSSGGLLIKLVPFGPLAVAGLRSAFAALFLLVLFRKLERPKSSAEWGATLTYTGTVICFVLATKWTTAANAILLQSTAPIYVALFGGLYLGEKVRPLDWLCLVVVLVGMVFFFEDGLSTEGFEGNVVALLSGLFFSWLRICL